ncbi:hypothetical protein [Streptomyces sp. NBC_01233]|uniref:hypothetical protein n=1 Tax=Streptomyces sp. NBC_01233 TaxID=2903787 RepID=UPI002E0FFFAA|nr:hypothetical protein OG332_00205 [Streptomyces sp. NBC_01233]WSP95311.1 hypothetical protein OG332_46780 [Streptomyces sp. NBC_01233]
MAALGAAALTSGCSTLPDDGELRAMATTAGAQHKRDAEEVRLRALLGRFDGIEGLRPGFTVVSDVCTGPSDGGFKEEATVHLMSCSMSADAVYGVEGDITEVLRRIGASGITTWSKNVNGPGSASGGSLDYALMYHQQQGVFPQESGGLLMPAPYLKSEAGDLSVGWDYPPLPGNPPQSGQVADDHSCPADIIPIPYSRCATDPARPPSIADLRARYGTVLRVSTGSGSHRPYLTVPRPGDRTG